jgi:hypothetical protein
VEADGAKASSGRLSSSSAFHPARVLTSAELIQREGIDSHSAAFRQSKSTIPRDLPFAICYLLFVIAA